MNVSDFFTNPTFWGIGLAVVFGTIWLVFLAPQKLNRVTAWLVLIMGAAVFAPCIVWIQIPLQSGVTDLLLNWLGQSTLMNYVYLTAIPIVLLSGIVQEGAKLIPTVVFWLFKERSLDPKLGLSMGAMAGAGFGVLEAQWINNLIFSSGWTLEAAQSAGFMGFAGLWERLFTVGFHISLGAISGWGLAKGWGWQFYLIVAFIHSLSNYNVIFVQTGKLTGIQVEIIIAVIAVLIFIVAAWLRWRKSLD